jgi:serine/threonine-protein kinase
MPECLSREQLERFLAGRLPEAEEDSLCSHVQNCPSCQHALECLVAWTNPPPADRDQGAGAAATFLQRLEKSLLDRSGLAPAPGLGRAGRAEETRVSTAAEGPEVLPEIPGYEVLGVLGQGGMGMVLRAHDPVLARPLAIKVLLRRHRGRADAARRFLEEARLTGQLQHPAIPPVHEMGTLTDGRPFFAMKLIQGRTLAQLLGERPDPGADLPRFLGIFEAVCQAVAYAHSRGVIHRDLKPSNVMVGGFGEVQVMDWGLAKVLASPVSAPGAATLPALTGPGSPAFTQAGSVLGTPAYMAPEQARGEPIDQRADVFGLGAILCEVLTGKPPYAEAGAEAVHHATRGELGGAFTRLDGCDADGELVRLARACLAPRPDERPYAAAALAAALTAYLGSVAQRLRKAELAQAEARARAEGERKRRRLALALAATVVLALLSAGGTWLWLRAERRAKHERISSQVNQALDEVRDLSAQEARATGAVHGELLARVQARRTSRPCRRRR